MTLLELLEDAYDADAAEDLATEVPDTFANRELAGAAMTIVAAMIAGKPANGVAQTVADRLGYQAVHAQPHKG